MLINGRPLPDFRQGDPTWDDDVLGFSVPHVDEDGDPVAASRLGPKGCFVSSLADATVLADAVLNPRQVNEAAKRHRGFAAGTGSLILERAARSVGLVAPEHLRVREIDPSDKLDLDILTQVIELSLAPNPGRDLNAGFFVDGGFVLVNVDHSGDGRPDHWCCIVGPHPDGGWAALDPAPAPSFSGSIRFAPDGMATSTWGRSKKTGGLIVKNYRMWGLAPVGKVLVE